MTREMTLITGAESPGPSGSADEALRQFYQGFNACDLEQVAGNWAATPEISMANPLGGLKRGWPEIRSVYERLFSSDARVYVELYYYTLQETGELFIAVGRERGELTWGPQRVELAIRTSRIYRRIGGGWRQVHHHGSMDEPERLARYQEVVREANASRVET